MLIFREPSASDAGKIAHLHAKSWQQHYRGALSDAFLDQGVFSERLEVWTKRFRTSDPNQIITVAEADGEMVGFACAYLWDHPKYGTLLDNLHVVSTAQGLGIGTKLIAAMARKSAEHDSDSAMYLWVLEQNKKAIDFYTALGGAALETVPVNDIEEREVMKCRFIWPSTKHLYEGLISKQQGYER